MADGGAPIFLAVPVLWGTYKRFPLTTLLYVLIFLHALVLMVGGAYTYARVPLGFEIAEALGLHRNPYDKIGHFFQGLVPALVAREILIRGGYVRGRTDAGVHRRLHRPGDQRHLRIRRVGRGAGPGQGADASSDAGRPVGHAVRHVLRAHGRRQALMLLSGVHDRQIRRLKSDPSAT